MINFVPIEISIGSFIPFISILFQWTGYVFFEIKHVNSAPPFSYLILVCPTL